MRLLFVCSRNRLRSPTAAAVFSSYPGLEAMSAGTSRHLGGQRCCDYHWNSPACAQQNSSRHVRTIPLLFLYSAFVNVLRTHASLPCQSAPRKHATLYLNPVQYVLVRIGSEYTANPPMTSTHVVYDSPRAGGTGRRQRHWYRVFLGSRQDHRKSSPWGGGSPEPEDNRCALSQRKLVFPTPKYVPSPANDQ